MIVNVKGDGNCFYRALALTLGYCEDSYETIKILLHDYILSNQNTFDYLGDPVEFANKV